MTDSGPKKSSLWFGRLSARGCAARNDIPCVFVLRGSARAQDPSCMQMMCRCVRSTRQATNKGGDVEVAANQKQ